MTIVASIWTSASRVPSRVLIGLAALACVAAGEPAPLAGMWGAGDALLALDAQGGRLQLGCTLVRFDPVRLQADGRFRASGQAETLSAMPLLAQGEDDTEQSAPGDTAATLSGRIAGGAADLSLAIEGKTTRELHLVLGQRGTIARCL